MVPALLLLGCHAPTTDPAPTSDPVCAAGAVFDGTGCVAEACGLAPYGNATGDVYVDAAAASAGDGSADQPFATLDAALQAAPDGAIVVAAGRYPGGHAFGDGNSGLSLTGRCADLVTLDAAGAVATIAVEAGASESFTLDGLTLTGATDAALSVTGGQVVARQLVANEGLAAVLVTGGTSALDLSDAWLSGSPAGPSEGLRVADEAFVTVTDVAIAQTSAAAVDVRTSATLTGTGVRIDTVLPTDHDGFGLYADSGAVVDLADVDIVDASGLAVFTDGDRTSVTLSSGRIGPVVVGVDGAVGLWAQNGATITVADLVVEDTVLWGAVALQDGHLVMRDTVVTRVRSEGGTRDAGIVVMDGGTLDFEGLVVDAASSIGIVIQDGTVEGTDLLLSDLSASADGSSAGVTATLASTAHLSGVTMDDSVGAAFAAFDTGTRLDVQDAEAAGSDGSRGFVVSSGARVSCTRCVLTRAGVIAVVGERASRMDFDQITVGTAGIGLWAYDGGEIVGSGADVDRFTDTAAIADGAGSVVDLRDARVYGDAGARSVGAVAQNGGEVRLEQVDLRHTGLLAVAAQLGGARMELVDTRIGADGEWMGAGVQAAADCSLVMERVDIVGAENFATLVTEPGASLVLTDVTVEDTRRSPITPMGASVLVQADATATMTGLTTIGGDGPGLIVGSGAVAACTGCTLEDAGFAGVVLSGATLTLTDVAIGPSRSDAQAGGGVGIRAGPSDSLPARLDLVGGEVAAGPFGGVWLVGDGAWNIDGATVHGGEGLPLGRDVTVHGNAVYATGTGPWDGASGLRVAGATLADARIAVLLDDASAILTDVTWSRNALDLQQQRCDADTTPLAADVAPTTSICPVDDDLTVDLPWSYAIVRIDVGTE